jgi:hypothetical protein
MRAPVAFIIFNRPDLTERVFTEIARARPAKLLVIADGPRPGYEGEADRCAAAREIIERIDWPCEVSKNYSERNLGCAHRVASGLEWVFEQVEEAVILEDDCLPHPAFFKYCDDLLEYYRDDERVMHISGDQFIHPTGTTPFSYSFSRYCLSWGWATWRRAFRYYDFQITSWPTLRERQWLSDILGDERAVNHWTTIFDLTFSDVERVNTWDFQWVFACWAQCGVSVLPEVNLVSNIGYRADATHTRDTADRRANVSSSDLLFPLRHPPCMVRDRERDALIFQEVVASGTRQGRVDRLRSKCAAALPKPLRKSLSALRSRLAVGRSSL